MTHPLLDTFEKNARALVADANSPIYKELGTWLVTVMLANNRYEAVIDDTGYDVSSRPQRRYESFQLSDYQIVSEVLQNELTGNTVATYCPGAGLAAESLEAAAIELARDWLYSWTRQQFPQLFEGDGESIKTCGFTDDEVWELLSEVANEYLVVEVFGRRKLASVFSDYLPSALARRADERAAAEKAAQEQLRVAATREALGRDLRTKLNLRWVGRRFEKSNSAELLRFLREQATEGGGNRVAAALRLQPQTFSLSNSVAAGLLNEFREEF